MNYKLIKSYFSGHERSVNAKKNIAASFVIKGISIIISLMLVPMTIKLISPANYGIWLTLSSIVAWISFFDIGFGNGLKNKLAESFTRGDYKLAKIYVSTTYAIFSLIIMILILLFIIINPYLNWKAILNSPGSNFNELSTLASITFIFFCIQFLLQLIMIIITANQQPAKASLVSLFGNILSLLLVWLLGIFHKGSLINLGIVLCLSPVIVLIASNIWYFKFDFRNIMPSISSIKVKYIKDLMNLGLKFFIIQAAALILFQTNNLIITQLLGPVDVTIYNIAFKYFSVITMGIAIIMTPFWPAFTNAYTSDDWDWIKNIISKLNSLWIVLCIIIFIMIICSNLIYKLWVGNTIVVPLSLSVSIGIYVIINAWNGIYSNFLNGVGKIHLQLYSAVFDSICNIPLAIFLGKSFGISGIVCSSCILGAKNMVWTRIQYNKIINKNAVGLWGK
jgi:O-antigen/teichoic acid export membrane protein